MSMRLTDFGNPGGFTPPPAGPTKPSAADAIKKATRPDGSIDWTKVLIALAGLGVSAGIGALAAGGRGAMAATAGGLTGLREGYETAREAGLQEEKLTLLGRKQTLDEQRETARQNQTEADKKSSARREAATSYDLRGAVLPDLHPDDKTAIDTRKEKERQQRAQEEEGRRKAAEEAAIRGEKRREESTIRGEQRRTKKPKEKPDKPPSSYELRAEVESRQKEIERLSQKVRQPDPANPGKTILVLPPGNQEQIDRLKGEVEQFKTELKARGETILQKLGKAGKAASDTTRTEERSTPTATDLDAAAQRAFDEKRINPDTGAPFTSVAEAKSYLFKKDQERAGKR